jgi:predicted ATPase
VEIFNLFSFDHQVFDNIGELGIIIGPNNSGKSNFFRILEILKSGQSLKKNYIKFNEKISSVRILLEFKFEKSKIRDFLNQNSEIFFGPHAKDYVSKPNLFRIYKDTTYKENEGLVIEEAFEKVIFEFGVTQARNYTIFIKRVSFQAKKFNFVFVNRRSADSKYNINKMELTNPTKSRQTINNSREWQYDPLLFSGQGLSIFSGSVFDNEDNFKERFGNEPFLSFFLKPIIKFSTKMNIIEENRFFHHFSKIDAKTTPLHFEANGNNFPTFILDYDTNQREKLNKLNYYLRKLYPNLKEINQNLLLYPISNLFDIDYNPYIHQNTPDFPMTIPYLLENDLSYKLTFDKLGKGIQQLVIILTAILETEEDGLLLIEEPELFIHPQLQKILLSIIKENLSKYQVLITTHSPYFIDNSEENWSIHRVKRINKITHVFNDRKENLDLLFEDLGIKPSDYLMNNGMILVEGKDDIEFFKHAIPELLEEKRIILQQLGGKRDLHFWANAKLIENFTNRKFKFLIILDNDEGNREIINNKAKEIRDKILLLPVREIENLYLNPEILLELIKSSNYSTETEPTLEIITQIIKSAIDEKLILEKKLKFFFEDFPKVFSEKEKSEFTKNFIKNNEEGIITEEDRINTFLDKIEEFTTTKCHITVDKQYYTERFNSYYKEIKEIISNGEEWKHFPGKELKHRIFSECASKFGFRFEKESFYRIIREKGFIKENLLDLIIQKLA